MMQHLFWKNQAMVDNVALHTDVLSWSVDDVEERFDALATQKYVEERLATRVSAPA